MWCAERQIGYGQITVDSVCTYLLHLFNNKTPSGKDLSSGALNRIRSSISFFLQYDFPGLGNQMPVVRLFNYFYKARPNQPRYRVTWDVGVVLRFLAQWHPMEALSLKQLTLKTVMLVALTSSDRAQTLHALRTDQVELTDDGLVFVVFTRLKHTKPGSPASTVTCVEWDAPELNVAEYVLYYMRRTLKFRRKAWKYERKDVKQLFLSHRTGKPVLRASISRWIREVMDMAGIDIASFAPHSARGASISEATRRGATASQILAQGNWKNLGTYQRYYNREVSDTPIGRMILQASLCEYLRWYVCSYFINFDAHFRMMILFSSVLLCLLSFLFFSLGSQFPLFYVFSFCSFILHTFVWCHVYV